MRRILPFGLAFAALSAFGAGAQETKVARPELVLRDVVAGMPRGEQQEVRVFTATLDAGDTTPFHTHRFPVTVYVLEGAFTLEMEGRAPVTIRAGEASVEPPNVRMTGSNQSGGPTRLVIVYVSDPDTPFLDPVLH